MKSKKTKVIELIFFDQGRWQDGALKKSDVTFDDVQQAIQIYNDQQTDVRKKLSVGNPANFFKDLFRKHSSIIGNWPPSVMQHGFLASKQREIGFAFASYRMCRRLTRSRNRRHILQLVCQFTTRRH